MPYVVYILQCRDGTLYTGSTNDLKKRFLAHKNGVGAKYTRSHPPEKIVFTERAKSKGAALKREAAIKKMSRAQKLRLSET